MGLVNFMSQSDRESGSALEFFTTSVELYYLALNLWSFTTVMNKRVIHHQAIKLLRSKFDNLIVGTGMRVLSAFSMEPRSSSLNYVLFRQKT